LTTAPDSAFQLFREMHAGDGALVLPTAWDAASARIMEKAGARAIGTAGSAISHLLGRPDGDDGLPLDDLLRMTALVVVSTSLPVTGDLGGGYGDPAMTVAAMIEAGVVGVNLSDRAGPDQAIGSLQEGAAAVAAARGVAGVDLVINARTDVLDLGGSVDQAIERADAYLAAGADCVLVAGAGSLPIVEELVGRIEGPLNVAVRPGFATVAQLEEAGVRRISVTFAGAMWSALAGMATQLIDGRDASEMDARSPFPKLDRWFAEDLSRGSNQLTEEGET
jgi:2-methylisocitrate lyase-like PEP mutase family enzyme